VAEGECVGLTEVRKSMKARIAAFKNALEGGRTLLVTQAHARFHAIAAVAVFALAFVCRVTATEWALLVLSVMAVWVTEALNTALEFLADEVSVDWRERIKHAKNVAAFAVLSAAIGAVIVGVLVFAPYVLGA